MQIVQFIKLDERAITPFNAYNESAGFDLHVLEDTVVPPGAGVDVRTGLAMALPLGYFARIVGRSSALRKRGLLVVEGIIDQGFRGELFSYVYNPRSEPWMVELKAGDSVAQLIVQPTVPVQWEWVDRLPESVRGDRGFGSSGRIGDALAG